MNVVFRVDALKSIGMGHLMRCLALSEEFVRRGHNVHFFSKIDKELINTMNRYNVNYYSLDKKTPMDRELSDLINFSTDKNIDWIITDNYEIDSKYLKKIKKYNFKILSIDDTSQIYYHSNIVLNQNINAEKLSFRADRNTQFLLGTKFVMIRNELLFRKKKIRNKKMKAIFVTIGGSQSKNLLKKIILAIKSIPGDNQSLIIIGPLNKISENNDIFNGVEEKIQFIKSPKNMLNLYLKADVAITTGGSSCYEMAYFGIPNMIITISDNQINTAEGLDKYGCSIYLGKNIHVKSQNIEKCLRDLLKNDILQKQMKNRGMQLVDGIGKKRILDFIESYN